MHYAAESSPERSNPQLVQLKGINNKAMRAGFRLLRTWSCMLHTSVFEPELLI
jgi:hypothetical protein